MNLLVNKIIPILLFVFFTVVTSAKAEIKYDNIRFGQLSIADELPNQTIHSIAQDREGYMWFATKSGLCRFDGYDLKYYYHNLADSTSICSNFVNTLFCDHTKNHLWIATEGGICCYDPLSDSFSQYNIGQNNPATTRFAMSRVGDLFATNTVGVCRYDESTNSFMSYISLPKGANVGVIGCDNDDRMWIKNNRKILCYDMNEGDFIPLPHRLRSLSDDCRELVFVSTSIMLFRTVDELYLYDVSTDRLDRLDGVVGYVDFSCAEIDREGNLWIGSEYGIYVLKRDRDYTLIAHFEQRFDDLSSLNDSPIYSIYRDKDNGMWVGTYFGGGKLLCRRFGPVSSISLRW